jgi:hypothetical protein
MCETEEISLLQPVHLSVPVRSDNDHVIDAFQSNNLHQAKPSTDTTTMTSGILRWTSSIRDSMINDPGRQFFEDQVQSQGFLFLEEYLDNIWAAAKPE